MIRDTEAIDPAFIARLRDLRIVFVPMLAEERDPAKFALAKRNTKRLADGGVPIAVGSGGDMQREMDLMVEAGLSPADVLVAATRNGAAALHTLDQAGTIEPGKRADLLLLSANPAEDIRNLRKIDRSMRDGLWVERPKGWRPYSLCVPSIFPRARSDVRSGKCPALLARCRTHQSVTLSAGRDWNSSSAASTTSASCTVRCS